MEEFVDIPGYLGYKINKMGQVKGSKGWILKPWLAGIKDHKYYYVGINLADKKYKLKISRLVCLTFHANPFNHPIVDHINRNKLDDRADNLRWVSFGVNGHNKDAYKTSKTGIKGLTWCKRDNLWDSRISINKKQYAKQFKNKDDAIQWLKEMRESFQNEIQLPINLTQLLL